MSLIFQWTLVENRIKIDEDIHQYRISNPKVAAHLLEGQLDFCHFVRKSYLELSFFFFSAHEV